MAKRRGGGNKLRQRGFVVDQDKKYRPKKGRSKSPWSDPLETISRGGHRH